MAFGIAPGSAELLFSPIDSISGLEINNGEVKKISNKFLPRLLRRNLSKVFLILFYTRQFVWPLGIFN